MNSRIIGYIFLIVIGLACAILSGWVFLLEGGLRSLAFAFLGILIIIAGIVRIVRERNT